jgi:hypothetical protein
MLPLSSIFAHNYSVPLPLWRPSSQHIFADFHCILHNSPFVSVSAQPSYDEGQDLAWGATLAVLGSVSHAPSLIKRTTTSLRLNSRVQYLYTLTKGFFLHILPSPHRKTILSLNPSSIHNMLRFWGLQLRETQTTPPRKI